MTLINWDVGAVKRPTGAKNMRSKIAGPDGGVCSDA
jgi:hypothetical protein